MSARMENVGTPFPKFQKNFKNSFLKLEKIYFNKMYIFDFLQYNYSKKNICWWGYFLSYRFWDFGADISFFENSKHHTYNF